MPTYDYRCEKGHRYERREPFGSSNTHPCEKCGVEAARVLTAPAIAFKGSGWYKTDSRGEEPRADRKSKSDSSKASSSSESAKSAKSSEPSESSESAKSSEPSSSNGASQQPGNGKSKTKSKNKTGKKTEPSAAD